MNKDSAKYIGQGIAGAGFAVAAGLAVMADSTTAAIWLAVGAFVVSP